MRKIAILLSTLALFAVSSCQTVKGMGRDIDGAYKKIKKATTR